MIKMEEGMMQKFEEEIRALINRNSMENTSNTPDFVLAQFVTTCLNALNIAVQQRETYYGRDSRPSTSSEVEHDCNKEHPGQDVYNPPKPKDSSVGAPDWIPIFCDECRCHHRPTESCHAEPKPKDSEVWCEHMDSPRLKIEVIGKWGISFCPICGTPRPKPEPVKTLAEKFYDYWKTTTACHGHDACKDLSSIAHEHFKQENRHD